MALPIGFFDTATPTNGCTGWTLSPDYPELELDVHFYANAPAGQPGSVMIGSTTANYPRPDVNAGTGYPGNHGFVWDFPFDLITPCQIEIYVYAINPEGGENPPLSNSPKLMPLLTGLISNAGAQVPIFISASSQFAGAINSIIWNNVQFVYQNDHGQELQSAMNSQAYTNSWAPECYNPTEAGSYTDGTTTCTSSQLLAFSAGGAQLTTQSNMAFWANPQTGSGTCSSPQNTTVLSGVILTKTVELAFNANIPQAIQYQVSFQIPTDYAYPEVNTFEVIAWYLPNNDNIGFNTFLQYDPSTGLNTDVSVEVEAAGGDGLLQGDYPVIVAFANGDYAAGVYCPAVQSGGGTGYYQYDQFYFANEVPSKIGLVYRIPNIVPGNTYSFTVYLAVGTATNVTSTLGALIMAYPS